MKRLRTLLTYDLRLGIAENTLKYLLLAVLAVVGAWGFGREYLAYLDYDLLTEHATVLDHLAYIFWGGEPISEERDFRSPIPMLWLLIMITFTLIVGYYLYQQSEGFGRNILLKGESRNAWWLSKCIWCTVSAALAIASLVVGVLLCGMFQGLSWGGISWELLHMAQGVEGEYGTPVESVLLVTLLPLLILSAIALWQQVLSLILQPFTALLLVVAYYLAASFYDSPFLLGTYVTFCRNEHVVSGGWSLADGLLGGAAAYLLAVLVGGALVKRRDFLQKHQI